MTLVPTSHILRDGEPWYQVNMLANTLLMTERAVRKLAAKLPPSETSVLPVPTSNRGLQESLFVSRPGAIEIALLSKSPVRADVVRQIMGVLATQAASDPSRVTILEQQVGAQTTALQALHARLLRLEQGRKKLPPQRHYREVPDSERDEFLAFWWRVISNSYRTTGELDQMCFVHGLLPTLFEGCASERSRQTRLGTYINRLDGVEMLRTRRSRLVRLARGPLAQVISLDERRSS